jgi:AMP-binding enzyme
MTPDEPDAAAAGPPAASRIAIDDIFCHVARRRPDTLAMADAPNRETFTDGAPRRLSYAQAARVVEAIAARLRDMGLPAGSCIGIQLPNTVEHGLSILGVMRAEMVAAPLPLLWRRADAVAALTRIGAKAIITCGRAGSFDPAPFALRVAAEVFSIRYVCSFGKDLPDGVVPFDDVFGEPAPDAPSFIGEAHGNAAARIAAVSFEVGESGIVPVARTHLELLAGGMQVPLESPMAQDSVILSTIAPSSFAGLCLTLLPWLLSGGTLLLHHPFNSNILGRQWRDDRFAVLILPGPVAFGLADAGVFSREGPACVVAAWRAPERLAASPLWRAPEIGLVDVSIFGEAGLVAARRSADGGPAPIPLGPVAAPRGAGPGAVVVGELLQSAAGTVALRGPMVPHRMFPAGIEHSDLPHFKIGPGGLVDSGYSCRVDPFTQTMIVTGPPAGLVSVGGYRFPLADLQDAVGRIDAAATLSASSDPLLGQRLIGGAADRSAVRVALKAAGVNPLVAAAFG